MQHRAHLCLCLMASALMTAGCGGGGGTPSDSGTRDTGSRVDGCTTRCTGTDAGTDPDEGTVEEDADSTDIDAGSTDVDAGSTDVDAGSTDVDAGSTDTDSGVTDGDSGQPGTEVLPAFDAQTQDHIRALVAAGPSHGLSHDVVAKIGDSISESGSFLSDCGFGWYTLGSHTALGAPIQYFSMHQLGDGRNSLDRASLCAVAGWTAQAAIENGENSALVQELDAIHPQWALVMYGTNDLEKYDVNTYAQYLGQLVDMIEARGTVTVLSTIPPRTDDANYAALVLQFNQVVRQTAATRHLPLIDLFVALDALPDKGIGTDGVHPTLYMDSTDMQPDGCDFTDPAMSYGYNLRNLYSLEILGQLQTNY